jgi:hypothetical protein
LSKKGSDAVYTFGQWTYPVLVMASHPLKQVPHITTPRNRNLIFYTQATAPVTVQQAQTNALLSMLNLNKPLEPSISTTSTSSKAASALKVPAATGPPVWKILVLDQESKDILATVLRVQDLRDIGVTLHVYAFFNPVP